MDKSALRKKFAEKHEKHYKVAMFEEEGFKRHKCKKCGAYFWSLVESDTCGDAECEPYSFFKKEWEQGDYTGMWKKFAGYFKKHGHEVVGRYPVIARWRPDLHFTIASIIDFMRLEQGKVTWEYPANPLVVPQMCLRFPDIDNVGITGRHHTSFIMAGQHAFDDGTVKYWKDETIKYNYGYLTEVLGAPKEELRYKEDVWAMPDLSSFGPCLETFTRGMELVNSVFTEYTLKSNRIAELDMKVIDVGWGFERLVWYNSGAPTSYDASLGYAVEWMKRKSGVKYDKEMYLKYAKIAGTLDVDEHRNIEEMKQKIAKSIGVGYSKIQKEFGPLEAVYSIADHTKTLVFALADGALPSNVGGGYNLRVVLRRAQSFIHKYDFDFELLDVAKLHVNYLKPMFPELKQVTEFMDDVFALEIEKYEKTIAHAKKRIATLAKKSGGNIPEEVLVREYESNGITPEIIKEVAEEENFSIDVPDDIYSKITSKHIFSKKKAEEQKYNPASYPTTELLYYRSDGLAYECDAKIIGIQKDALILNKTCFYPEGGGQAYDNGVINQSEVKEVHKYGGVIFHVVKDASKFKVGEVVHCKVDKERRDALRRHHTATHIIGGVCRKLLGNHVWQAGAHKDVDKATLDITHYKALSEKEISNIEKEANDIVLEGHNVDIKEYERGEAEQKYGFILYQGGGSPGKRIRVVKVDDIDVEACGGLHVFNTREIGCVKIIKTERIQDGIVRLTYCAGKAAVAQFQKMSKILQESARVFSVTPEDLTKTCEKFFEEWKRERKLNQKYEEIIAEQYADNLSGVVEVDNISKKLMLEIAKKIAAKGKFALMINKEGFVVAAAGKGSGKNAKEEMEKLFKKRGRGSGGGSETLAMGKL